MNIEKLEAGNAAAEKPVYQNVTYAPTIKQKNVSPEGFMNGILCIIVAVLFAAILSAYFVEDAGGMLVELQDFAVEALWVIVCTYIIGELCKRIFINKARSTKFFQDKKKETEAELFSLTDEEREKRFEYCKEYEKNTFEAERDRLLKESGISLRDYVEKYQTLSKKELLARYPNDKLSKMQLNKLQEIRKIKPVRYNPDFLNITVKTVVGISPSEMYDVDKENGINMISSALLSIFGGVFGVSMAGELIFSFTPAAVFAAVVKTTITLITVALKARFGWNLVMRTEINRLGVQASEVKNLKRYCVKNK